MPLAKFTKLIQMYHFKNKIIMTRQQAHDELYSMWENGEVPSNFTEDHSEYETALKQMIRFGFIEFEDFF